MTSEMSRIVPKLTCEFRAGRVNVNADEIPGRSRLQARADVVQVPTIAMHTTVTTR